MNQSDKIALLQQANTELATKYTDLKSKYTQLDLLYSALFRITQLTNEFEDLSQFYYQVHQVVASLMNAKNFFIVLYDEYSEELEFVYFVDEFDTFPKGKVPKSEFAGSMSNYVISTGKTLLATPEIIAELTEQGEIQNVGTAGVDWLGTPLIRQDKAIGVLVVQSYNETTRYTDEQKNLLEFAAQHIVSALFLQQDKDQLQNAVALRTKELEEQIVERENAELLQESLYHISELSSASIDMKKFYKQVHNVIGQLLSASNFYIAKYDKFAQEIEFVYFVDQKAEDEGTDLTHTRRPVSNSFTDYVLREAKTCLFSNEQMYALYEQGITYKPDGGTNSWLGVPLMVNGEAVGVMVLQSYQIDLAFTEQDADLLNFVSQHVSTAIARREAAEYERESHNILEEQVRLRTSELEEEIEQRQLIEEQLKHNASHDALTGLPNRTVFQDMLNHAIATKQRRNEFKFAVLFLDLDRFKTVNDSLGHHAGDKLLKIAAEELKTVVREMDTVARLGGDEFVILIEELENVEEAIYIANRIKELMETPFLIEGQEVYIGTSIGIVFSDERYEEASIMLRDADTAMYRAKAAGKGRYEVFDASMQLQVLNNLTMETDIRIGIDKNEFVPYFQPIMDISSNKLVGFEALARWESSKRGFIAPGEFISIAEENGLINYIDMLIATQAVSQLKEWQELTGDKELYISSNLYCDQFFDPTLPQEIEAIIENSKINPNCLRLELTERALLENADVVLANMQQLKKMGVTLMLDDFGTGYSSLSYLYRFPLDTLKIDRSFVANMHEQESSKAIVKTIIDLAKNLKMSTVAEGIEKLSESQILHTLGCNYGQGYYYAKPMSAKAATEFLLARSSY